MYNYTKSMAKPELSIIIVSYNTKTITQNCLESISKSLKNSRLNYEVIVVDNGSIDGSQAQISNLKTQSQSLKLKTIFNKKNVGFGPANNQGVKIATGKYIFMLNSDIVVLNDAIEKILGWYKTNENKIHLLGGKLLEKDGSTPQPSCGPFYSLPVIFAALFLKGDYWGLTRYSPNQLRKVGWISGACILTKKEYYERLGGFDEGIFLYMEEIDLLYRAHLKKLNTFFCPDARFIHIGFASSGSKTSPIINVYRGFLYLYKKHFSPASLFFLKLLLQFKALIAIVVGRITGNQYAIKTYEQAIKMV